MIDSFVHAQRKYIILEEYSICIIVLNSIAFGSYMMILQLLMDGFYRSWTIKFYGHTTKSTLSIIIKSCFDTFLYII